ncbi:MAG: hypothetical protein ACREKS_19560 [Candidatus Rokuibacteriota bacterium]
MSDLVTVVAVLARFAQVGSGSLLTGIFAFLVVVVRPASRAAGPAHRDAFETLDRRLLRLALIAVAVAMSAGLIDLIRQALIATGSSAGAGLAPRTIGLLLTQTRYGDFWLVRQSLWLLLGTLLVLRGPSVIRRTGSPCGWPDWCWQGRASPPAPPRGTPPPRQNRWSWR